MLWRRIRDALLVVILWAGLVWLVFTVGNHLFDTREQDKLLRPLVPPEPRQTTPAPVLPPSISAQYTMKVKYQPVEHFLEARVSADVFNQTGRVLSNLYFHFYPAAFNKADTAPLPRTGDAPQANWQPGQGVIKQIRLNGQNCLFKLEGTQLNILLPALFQHGQKLSLQVDFTIKLPQTTGRMGYQGEESRLGNWYPILAVYDELGWNLDPYYAVGDPFYSETGDYLVTLEVPVEEIVGATGYLEKAQFKGKNKILTWRADNVRDFAWVSSSRYSESIEKGSPVIYSLYYPEHGKAGERVLKIARQVLNFCENYIGPYPYPEVRIAEVDFLFGGMEYPNLVYIAKKLYENPEDEFFEFAVAHELIHQWWYNIVGNDQVEESWLDEALTNYTTYLYFADAYGLEKAREIKARFLGKGRAEPDMRVKPLNQYRDMKEYSKLVYQQGALVLDLLKEQVGSEKFQDILQRYYHDFQYKNARIRDFIDIVEEITGNRWDDFFARYLYNQR